MQPQLNATSWQADQHPYLTEMTGKTIFMLYSGGKDSSLALYYLARVRKHYGFTLHAHASIFPTHRYTPEHQTELSDYWHRKDVRLTWHPAPGTEKRLTGSTNACRPCQQIRKRWLKHLVAETDIPPTQLVLAVGFSLWDLASYAIEAVVDHWRYPSDTPNPAQTRRFQETSQRFYPLLKMQAGYWVYRPMIRYTNPDIKAAIDKHRIPRITVGCRWADQRPKRHLDGYFEQFGRDFSYDKLFAFATDVLALPPEAMCTQLPESDYLAERF